MGGRWLGQGDGDQASRGGRQRQHLLRLLQARHALHAAPVDGQEAVAHGYRALASGGRTGLDAGHVDAQVHRQAQAQAVLLVLGGEVQQGLATTTQPEEKGTYMQRVFSFNVDTHRI